MRTASGVVLAIISLFTAMAVVDPLGLIARFGIWKILAIVFALLNVKNLPFIWHVCILPLMQIDKLC